MWPFDPNKQQMYQQYAQAYNTGNYSNIDPNEAREQLQQFVQNAPPDEQRQVFQRYGWPQPPVEVGITHVFQKKQPRPLQLTTRVLSTIAGSAVLMNILVVPTALLLWK